MNGPPADSNHAAAVVDGEHARRGDGADGDAVAPEAVACELRVGTSAVKGRVMNVDRPVAAGALLLLEPPRVAGHCRVDGCPCGCDGAGSSGCGWRAIEANDAFNAARTWQSQLCQRALELPEGERSSVVRASCLLAIVMQAAAQPRLWKWIEEELRPAVDDPEHPFGARARENQCAHGIVHVASHPAPRALKRPPSRLLRLRPAHPAAQSSSAFAQRFAELVPPPTLRLRLGLKKTGGAAAWASQMQAVLMRLQSN
eukprot:7135872-Prymnesium_polylepis.1